MLSEHDKGITINSSLSKFCAWRSRSYAAGVLLLLTMFSMGASAQTLISISNPPAAVNATAPGTTQFWLNAGTVNGTPVSLRATVQSITGSVRLFTSGDNPVVRTNVGGSMATINWEITNRATGAPILADPNFLITDIDGNNGTPNESVSAACTGLTSFTVNGDFVAGCNANSTPAICQSNIRVTESGGNILAEGTQNQNGSQQEGYMQYSWTSVSNWVVNYMSVTGGRWFVHDADGDVPFDGTEISVNLVDMATIKGVTATSLTAPAQGELITFQIDMSNLGPEIATGANLTDLLPAGLMYISDTTTSGSYDPITGVWSGVTVGVNQVETLTITAQVTAPAGTTITNESTTALANESICSSRDLLEYEFVVAETPAPSLSIIKSIDPVTSFDGAGDTITYSYEVMNTGNINIDNVMPVDGGPTFGGQPASNSAPLVFNPASATLTPGQTQIFTATYVLDQADVDNMALDPNPLSAIDNTATATGTPTGGVALPAVNSSTVETGFAPDPSLSIIKAVSSATSFSQAGDTITYQYTISNTGNITIEDVSPTDSGPTFNGLPAAGALSIFNPASADIAPNSNAVFTATYILQQADIDNLAAASDPLTAIDNTASATGDPVGNTALPVVANSTAETGLALTPSMTIAKSVSNATSFSQEGDTITYEYELLNTGNVTINNAVPTDTGPTFNGAAATNSLSAFSPASVTLVAGAPATTVTATYVLAQQDIDNMLAAPDTSVAIANTASATGTPIGGTLAPVADSSATTGFALAASLSLEKSAGSPSIGLGLNPSATDEGDTIVYSFDVNNDGDVSLSNISINDLGTTFNGIAGTGTLSAISCPLTALAPGQMTTCLATYTLSQADVDNGIAGGAGAVMNTASAAGQDPANNVVTSSNDTATQTIVSDSSITIEKSASAPTIINGADATLVDPGDTISYMLDVNNTGNTTLSSVLVSDSIATVTCPAVTDLGNAFVNDGNSQLSVGDGIVCTAVYALQQVDLDTGGVQNTADVASIDPTLASVDASDTVNSGFTQKTSIALVKTAILLPTPASDGDPITYTFNLTNTGNVTLTSPEVTDPMCEVPVGPLTRTNGFVSGDTGTANEMEAGETWVFECIYNIDQADVDAGQVDNLATGTGTPPAASGLPDPESTATNLTSTSAQQSAAIALDKSSSLPTVAGGSLPNVSDVGDIVNYTFEVENTGTVTLSNVVVSDPLITGAPNNGVISCPAGIASMAPGDIVSCTASYSLVQTDIDAGVVVNTASAVGTPPLNLVDLGAPMAESSNMVTIAPMPNLDIDKSVAPLIAPLLAGTDITYTFVISNTGNVTVRGVEPTDLGPTFNGAAAVNRLSAFNPASIDIAPGVSESFTATYTLDQTDIDNIAAASDPLTAIDNSASATGVPDNGSLPTIAPDTTETGAAPNPSVALVKLSQAPPALIAQGDEITYTFELNNDGNVTISNPVINDSMCSMPGTVLSFNSGFVSGDSGTAEALDVGETWVFSCTYAVSQADINAGTVANTATGGGQDPSGDTVSDTDQVDTTLAQTSSFTVAKSTASTPSVAGDTLLYQFIVDNTGNVNISNVNVMDAKCAGVPVLVSGDVGSDLVLSPPEIWTYECTSIAVTQLEVNSAMVDNEVDVTGSVPPGAPALLPADDSVSTPIAPMPSLAIDKTAGLPTTGLGALSTATDQGDTITYTFDVVNDGNVTISGVIVNDNGPTFDSNPGAGTWSGVSCPSTVLLPLQSTTCTATYTLDQLDIDRAVAAGVDSVDNSATAEGLDPNNNPVTSPSDVDTTTIESNSEIQIIKTAAAPTVLNGTDSSLTDPGDTIEFTIEVENIGNTTLSNVLVTDSLIVLPNVLNCTTSTAALFVNDGTSSLAVGESITCTGTYVIEQADINAGMVLNVASVEAQDPAGETEEAIAEAISPFTQKTSLSLIKTASTLPASPPEGSLVTYTFELENTGNVTLTGAQIDDPQCQIPPGPLTATNGLDLASDVNSDGLLDAGETWTFNCDYAITTADILAMEITNIANATGTPPVDSGLDSPEATSSALVAAQQNAAITLDKVAGIPTTADGIDTNLVDVGDTVTFSFNIQNTGNIPFDSVTLNDPLITAAPNNGSFVCELNDGLMTPFVLAPGSSANPASSLSAVVGVNSVTCTAEYTLTQADIDAGDVANTATIIGNTPMNIPPPPEAISGSTVPVPPAPSLSIVKTASPLPSTVIAGTTITYTYVVTNTGNVTIENAAPIDLGPSFNGVSGTNALSLFSTPTALPPPDDIAQVADIAPFSSATFTATYVISQQDLDNMAAAPAPLTAIDNTATADGEPVNGTLQPVPPSTVETGVDPSPALELIKTSTITTPVGAGSVITYTFMLNNVGNVTISNPIVTDAMCQSPASPLSFSSGFVSGDTGAIAQSLDVGETWVFECDYLVTQANVDAGTVQNTANGSGQDPAGGSVDDDSDTGNAGDGGADDDDPTNTLLPRNPGWVVDKSTTSVPTAAGQTLDYSFVLSNTGNTTISGITVADGKCVGGFASLDTSTDIGSDNLLSPAGVAGVPAAESWTYSCTSIPVTQDEMDAGVVINDVTAMGSTPGGGLSDATDREETTVTQTPSMSLVKSAGAATLNNDGSFDQEFNFEVKNLGNISLTSVTISDNIPAQFGACYVGVAQSGVLSVNDVAPVSDTINAALGSGSVIAMADSVGVGDSVIVSGFSVTLNPNASGCTFPDPAQNTATAGSDQVTDDSDDGTDPDITTPNGPGTPTTFTPPIASPELGLAKSARLLSLNDDFSFDVEFTVMMQNTGDVDLTNLQMFDDLVTQFGAAYIPSAAVDTSGGIIVAPVVSAVTDAGVANLQLPTVDASFNGGSGNLFDGSSGVLGVGDIIQVIFTARANPTLLASLPDEFSNVADGAAFAPDGSMITDQSNSGNDPTDGSGGGVDPTVIALDDIAALPIVLGQFGSVVGANSLVISWQTQTEVGNLGFNLYGKFGDEWRRLNDDVIPGQGDSIEVSDYSFTAQLGATALAISDVNARGEEELHGPFMVGQVYGAQTERKVTDWSDTNLRRQLKQKSRDAKRREQMLERNRARQRRKLEYQQENLKQGG